MSGSSSYFFQPGIPERNNPFSPPRNFELTRLFAQSHAAAMDQAAELFYTEERYDDFYAGKGSTYPDLHGAVGILFEQGSTRGLRLRNTRTDRHFRDTIANQVRTSLSSIRAANQWRDPLLSFQTDFYRRALQLGRVSATTAYLLTGSASRIQAAGELLKRHSIAIYQPADAVRFQGELLPPQNVLVVPSAQSEFTFVRSLMEPPAGLSRERLL